MSRLQAIRFNASCAVCYEDYAEGDNLTSPDKCGHVFHKACLDKWLEQKNECPTCRGAITIPATPTQVANQIQPPIIQTTRSSSISRSTPNIYGQLNLMETVYLFNVLQALVKPIEYYGYSYQVAYPEIIECLIETFNVPIGKETAHELYNKIIHVPPNTLHKFVIVSVCETLYKALIRHIPEQNFGSNPIIKESYTEVCAIPTIQLFRQKYMRTIR
jgi:hypothetical protein